MMRFLLVLQVLMVAVPVLAGAQTREPVAWPVAAGSRIRIQSPILGDRKHTATVTSARSDTLFFRTSPQASDLSLAPAQITTLDVASGTRTRVRKGAFYGFLIGGLLGAAAGAATYEECEACLIDFERSETALITGVLGGAIGLLAGTLYGLNRVDTWVPVQVPE